MRKYYAKFLEIYFSGWGIDTRLFHLTLIQLLKYLIV